MNLLDKMLCLAIDMASAVMAIWFIAIAFSNGITVDSRVARFGMAAACMAVLFSRRKNVKLLFIFVALVLIAVATFIYLYK